MWKCDSHVILKDKYVLCPLIKSNASVGQSEIKNPRERGSEGEVGQFNTLKWGSQTNIYTRDKEKKEK